MCFICFFLCGLSKFIGLYIKKNLFFFSEKSNLAVTISDEKNNVVAHAAFLDYPSWDVIDQAEWEDWMHKNYEEIDKCTVSIKEMINAV